jgi:creatinine amidohydrolase
MAPSTSRLAHLTREQAGERIPASIVILPTAAIEQHGPHLPLDTDSCIVENIVERAAASIDLPVLWAPVVVYGASHHHFPFPGVMSLASETFGATVRDLLRSLAKSGAQRVYILNGHGGNDEMIRLIAREEARALTMAIGAASYWSLAWEELLELHAHTELGPLPGHAGAFETSIMLTLRPNSVRTDLLSSWEQAPTSSIWPVGSRGTIERPDGPLERGNGMSDDAMAASVEWGNKLLDIAASSVAKTLQEFYDQT